MDHTKYRKKFVKATELIPGNRVNFSLELFSVYAGGRPLPNLKTDTSCLLRAKFTPVIPEGQDTPEMVVLVFDGWTAVEFSMCVPTHYQFEMTVRREDEQIAKVNQAAIV